MEKLSAIFFLIGALDYLTGNHLKIGRSFYQGFCTLPELMILMTGFMVLAPWLGDVISPIICPFFLSIGCDPSLFAGLLLSCDSGGAVLAEQLALTKEAALYNGMIVGAYFSCILTFTIPMALTNTTGERKKEATTGLVTAFLLIPISCVITGTLCHVPLTIIFFNTLPILVLSLALLFFFRIAAEQVSVIFNGLSYFVRFLALAGLTTAILQETFGITILKKTESLDVILPVIGRIAIFLAGILPFFTVLQRTLTRPLEKTAQFLGISHPAMDALLLSLANSIPVLLNLNRLEIKDVRIVTAFAAIAAFAVGDHLAFAVQFYPDISIPFMAGKILSGLLALVVCVCLRRSE